MSGTFRIPLSNSLQFVRTEDETNPQTDFNRLYGGYEYYNRTTIDFAQKYNQGDDLWVQFRTNYLFLDIKLIDSVGNETALTYSTGNVYDDYTYYQVDIDTNLLSGCYYVYITLDQDSDKPIAHYKSNWFNVKEDHKNTLLIEWYGGGSGNDGIDWGDKTQELRVEGWMLDDISASEKTTTRDDNNNLVVLNNYPIYKKRLQLNLVPNYICQLLNIAVGHDIFVINGQVWINEDAFDFGDRHGYTQMYSPSAELELKDYENYAEDEVLTGELPVVLSTSLAFNSTTSLAFNSTTSLKFK